MGGRRIALVMLAALSAGVASGGAFAQPKDPKDPGGDIEMNPEQTGSASPALAKKWLAAAQALMQKGSSFAARNRPDDARAQFENAVIAYQKALSAGGDVNVYADLANAEDKLGKLGDAMKHLRRVVTAKTGVRPDVARRAAAKLEDLSAKVGLVTLIVTPAGSSITLGGVELGTSPLPEPLVLMPGTYTLSFQADGFQPKEAAIKVEPGSEIERTLELEPVRVVVEPVKPAAAEAPLQDAQRNPPSPLPFYVGAAVTGAGVLDAGIFGVLAVSQHSKFTAASTSSLDRQDARTTGQRFALITDLSLGTAVMAAGITAYWYFTKYRQHPKKPEERHPPLVVPTARDSETKLGVVPWSNLSPAAR